MGQLGQARAENTSPNPPEPKTDLKLKSGPKKPENYDDTKPNVQLFLQTYFLEPKLCYTVQFTQSD